MDRDTTAHPSDAEKILDARIAVLKNVGMPRELMLKQLLIGGAPIELLKVRFSELPSEAFVRPAARVPPERKIRVKIGRAHV